MKFFTDPPYETFFHNLSAMKIRVYFQHDYLTPVLRSYFTSITYSFKQFFLTLQFSTERYSETVVIVFLSLSFTLLNKQNTSS